MNKVFLIIISVILLIQLIPINQDNPEISNENEITLSGEVKQIIETSCFDCHSNKTVWPWYSYIAPVSWFVAMHVDEGRLRRGDGCLGRAASQRRNRVP